MNETGHRRIMMLRGSAEQTRAAAQEVVAALDRSLVLWVGPDDVPSNAVPRLLGRSFDACVIDLHHGLDADLLGACHGFVVGGGALIIRAPERPPPHPQHAAHGYRTEDVGHRFYDRVTRVLTENASEPRPLEPSRFLPIGSDEQRAAVAQIVKAVRAGTHTVLTADRGRGKSAALGMVLTELDQPVAITSAHADAVREIFEFAPAEPERLRYVSAPWLLREPSNFAAIFVDEAAQLPVSLLQALTRAHDVPFVFATTTHGYEGTGRGFSLRFVDWLRSQPRQVVDLQLNDPIRWDPDDPAEATVFDALLLDAETARLPDDSTHERVTRHVDRDELANDEGMLRELFGLLIQAHYRTTPSDLHRLLDAPNMAVHATFVDGRVVAATLVAREGALDESTTQALADGRMRVVGHALAETFAAHLNRREGATLQMLRSVRIATHPSLRRCGIASELVQHVHDYYRNEVDLFGTLFGATEDLLRFRHSVGYEVVRLSASRGSRTGVPSVAMIYPVTDAGRQLTDEIRDELADTLGIQLELVSADGAVQLSDELRALVQRGLREPQVIAVDAALGAATSYAHGPRTFESVAAAMQALWDAGALPDERLHPSERALIQARLLQRRGWVESASAATYPSVPAAMRAMRRAVRKLLRDDW